MTISFECSDCGANLKVKEQFGGRRIRCPHCEAVIRVPAAAAEEDDLDFEEEPRSRASSGSSRSKQAQRSPTRRRRPADEDELEEELPQPSKSKKKKPKKSKSGSGGGVPMWAIVAGSSVAGVLLIAGIVFMATKGPVQGANGQVAGAGQAPAEQPKVVQAQVDGPGAKFRMKFEMPANWTSEGSIEDEMFPWATMKGDGQSIKLSSNRSLLGGAEAMTTVGGAIEQLKASHSGRGVKLQSENTDWVDGPIGIHEGKNGTVVWTDYEYKGVFGKGYGIRCTVDGAVRPCQLMIECGQSARDKWRPTLLAIAESIHFVAMKDGKEDADGLGIGGDDIMDAGQPDVGGGPDE